ncbi:c-type cytochrome biogenesis protein CcmI [Thioalbus denitrificans]|uniref:Cytochrome c-type biogenesis protein CcmH n=1 Tax=Thioalbus denitrificans TaxID=547122 RepID=A0A369CE80_9GAMM|nr:c-type cytochrome biogenesis protein CcmI [Thioalbus denitrificans]RCX32209.1 cytochrome c-type biogenesis protein CcmH [Thioalbus denitrificans]
MTTLWIVFAVLVLAALAIVVPPLLRRRGLSNVARDELNLAIHGERLTELKRLFDEAEMTRADYDQAVLELEQDLADDLAAGSDRAQSTQAGRWAAVLVVVLVPLLSVGLYNRLGNADRLADFETSAEVGRTTGQEGMPSIDKMVSTLEQKLRENPDQPEGWFLLGRSYLAMDRPAEAAEALRKANEMQPGNAQFMVTYAQALALSREGDFSGEPLELIRKVLDAEPENAQGLFLAGVANFQQGSFEQAILFWRKVLAMQPPESEDSQLLQTYIQRASTLLAQQGGQVPAMEPPVASAVPQAPAAGAQTPEAGSARLTVQVSLAPELADQVKPTDTVFVFAVAAQGPRMPLAIQRLTAAELPVTVELDDSMAMMPAMKLSSFPEVTVGARVSFSGDAIAKSGDFEGRVTPVTVAGAKEPIAVVIDTKVP